MRARYAKLTDRLITMLDGTADEWRPSHVVYLDKSGRPVAWLVKALWPLFAREPGIRFESAVTPHLPRIHFANIDREHWWDVTGATETGRIDIGQLPGDVISQLRTVFLTRQALGSESAFDVPSWLDAKRVLIVDEVRVSGDTLRIAEALVRSAFPTAEVRSTHWMTPSIVRDKSGQQRNADVPIWYRSDTWEGRLIGNRLDSANPSSTWRNREGCLFLSTRPRERDELGVQLKMEVSLMAEDIAAGRLLAAPSLQRDPDDWAERVRVIYGYKDPREFTAARLEDEDRDKD